MDNTKSQLAEKLKSANNILVTVSRDPSVDQLAACIGLTLILNKLNKHAAAIFSGQIPSTIDFLEPEETLEKNTDSLRDFIISLDKSKADKLRYKVEDNVVRIFITPYKTSIGQSDLEFSEGDFNVDIIVAIGVNKQEDLDTAITAHGRILHDATVSSINNTAEGGLGSIAWHDPHASSLSELVTELGQQMAKESKDKDKDLIDGQIATALLTGIVAETDRFSNDKTSSQTMSVSAVLLSAGANQQLVATKLQEPRPVPRHESYNPQSESFQIPSNTNTPDAVIPQPYEEPPTPVQKRDPGTLEIKHDPEERSQPHAAPDMSFMNPVPMPTPSPQQDNSQVPPAWNPPGQDQPPVVPWSPPSQFTQPMNDPARSDPFSAPQQQPEAPRIKLDNQPMQATEPIFAAPSDHLSPGTGIITEPPSMGGTLTANYQSDDDDPGTDPFSQLAQSSGPLLEHSAPAPQQNAPFSPPPVPSAPMQTPQAFMPPTPEPVPQMAMGPNSDQASGSLAPAPAAWVPPTSDSATDNSTYRPQTLSELEASVHSPHVASTQDVDAARNEVNRALDQAGSFNESNDPAQALNAQPLGSPLHNDAAFQNSPQLQSSQPDDPLARMQQDLNAMPTVNPFTAPPANDSNDAGAPPPVPPPMPFQFGGSGQ
jgi:hypothetical protein